MELTKLRIRNYKGIRDTEIGLVERSPYAPASARVHTLVGINESGKTTLLEAMNFFSPDGDAWKIANQTALPDFDSWIPKHLLVGFDGAISMTGTVMVSDGEWAALCEAFAKQEGYECEQDGLPEQFEYKTRYEYRTSKMIGVESEVNFLPRFRVCGGIGGAWREDEKLTRKFTALVRRSALPAMVYYPSFLFDFPKEICLTDPDRTPVNRFYYNLFQDILSQVKIDGDNSQKFTIEQHILGRMREKEAPYAEWRDWMGETRTDDKISAVALYVADRVTQVVLGEWNDIYGRQVGEKRVLIRIGYAPGKSQNGAPATKHDAYAQFRIESGTANYDINDRSLGFRWFFAFLLFTRFRAIRGEQRPLIFLLDEPAANLYPSAQKALLDSFPEIVKSSHRLVYSTHSHYMVRPQWLEQAFIAFDNANDPSEDVLDQVARPLSQVDIKALPYRQFVQKHQDKASYFMPVLDALNYQPSLLEHNTAGLIVEGKSDYYHIQLAKLVTDIGVPPIFPAFGAGNVNALVALHLGWGAPVRVMFDSDKAGREGISRLKKEFHLSDDNVTTIGRLLPNTETVENIYSIADIERMLPVYSELPVYSAEMAGTEQSTTTHEQMDENKSKTALWRRAQELAAMGDKGNLPKFDAETVENMKKLLEAINRFVKGDGNGE